MFTPRYLIEISVTFLIYTLCLTLLGVVLDKLVLGPAPGESVFFSHNGGLLVLLLAGLLTWRFRPRH